MTDSNVPLSNPEEPREPQPQGERLPPGEVPVAGTRAVPLLEVPSAPAVGTPSPGGSMEVEKPESPAARPSTSSGPPRHRHAHAQPTSEELLHATKQVVWGVRALAGLLGLAILAILSFHPWLMTAAQQAASVLPLLLLVLIFVYVVGPVVDFFHRQFHRIRGLENISRERSLALTYIILLGVLAICLGLLVPPLVEEARTLAASLPRYSESVRSHFLEYRDRYASVVPPALQEQIASATRELGQVAGKVLQQGVSYAGAVSQAVAFSLAAVIFVPLLGFYFLKDHEGVLEFLLRLVDERRRAKLRHVLGDLHSAMQNFIKGQVILCLCIGVITWIAMMFVLPSFAIGLAIVAGITEAIPVVGPLLGSIPAIIIAFASQGPTTAAIVALIYLGIQQIEGVVLVPRVMGESLGLHPLSLIVGMMAFGNVFGFWGVVLAAPLVAAVKVIVMHYFYKTDAADEATGTGSTEEHDPSRAM